MQSGVLTQGSQICELTLNYPSDTPLWDEFDQGLHNLIVTLSSISNALQGEMQSSITQLPLQSKEMVSQFSKVVLQTKEMLPLVFAGQR